MIYEKDPKTGKLNPEYAKRIAIMKKNPEQRAELEQIERNKKMYIKDDDDEVE